MESHPPVEMASVSVVGRGIASPVAWLAGDSIAAHMQPELSGGAPPAGMRSGGGGGAADVMPDASEEVEERSTRRDSEASSSATSQASAECRSDSADGRSDPEASRSHGRNSVMSQASTDSGFLLASVASLASDGSLARVPDPARLSVDDPPVGRRRLSSNEESELETTELEILSREGAQCWAVIIASGISSTFLAVLIFGWGPLELLFLKDGVYRNLCPAGGPDDCEAARKRLSSMYTAAMLGFYFGMTISGAVISKFGPIVVHFMVGVLMGAGSFLLGGHVELIPVGCVLMAIGGGIDLLVCYESAPLTKHRTIVMTVLGCMSSLAAATPIAFYQLYEAGLGRPAIFISFGIMVLALHTVLALIWCGLPREKRRIQQARQGRCRNRDLQQELEGPQQAAPAEAATAADRPGPSPLNSRPRLHSMTLKRQMVTFDFFWATVSYCVYFWVQVWFNGTLHLVLIRLGDAKTGYLFSQMFGLMNFAGPISSIFVGWILSKGSGKAYATIAGLGVLCCSTALVPSLYAQTFTMAAYIIFRDCAISTYLACASHVFGVNSAAIVSTANVFLVLTILVMSAAMWAIDAHLGEDLVAGYIVCLGLILAMLPLTFVYHIHIKRNPTTDIRSQASPTTTSGPTCQKGPVLED